MPWFKHGLDLHSLISLSQSFPVNPTGHWHTKSLTRSMHRAPYLHGLELHSSIFVSQFWPIKQTNMLSKMQSSQQTNSVIRNRESSWCSHEVLSCTVSKVLVPPLGFSILVSPFFPSSQTWKIGSPLLYPRFQNTFAQISENHGLLCKYPCQYTPYYWHLSMMGTIHVQRGSIFCSCRQII